jgi:hypothetical protein
VDFDLDTSMTVVQRKVVSGTIVGKPSRAVTTAAFVFIGKPVDVKDVHPAVKFEKSKQAGSAVYSLTDDNRTVTWTTSSKEQPDAASAISFRLEERRPRSRPLPLAHSRVGQAQPLPSPERSAGFDGCDLQPRAA